MRKGDSTVILGVPVFRGDTDSAIQEIFEFIRQRESEQILITMNVDFVVNALCAFSFEPRNRTLLELMRRSPLVTADGMPILLLARLLGVPLPERVTGADMVPRIVELSAGHGTRFYVLGGNAENTRKAIEILTERYGKANFVGVDTPFVKLDKTPECELENLELCKKINSSSPDILFVCLGNPKQELWAEAYAKYLNVPVIIGVGGTFNFISGDVKRAPLWMQKNGLEWIYRIIQEPERLLKRYSIGLIKFNCMALTCIAAAWIGCLIGKASQQWVNRETRESGDKLILNCQGLSYVDNSARLTIVDALIESQKKGKTLHFENLSIFAKFQVFAHRLNK